MTATIEDVESVRRRCSAFREVFAALMKQVRQVIVGHDEAVSQVLIALFADGHVLLEGVPGLGKTLLVRTLSQALTLPFARIQFTPDVMPADIIGTNIFIEDESTGHRSFQFRPGPVFSQLLLADEINRATPKSQSALLEAMQERSVTVAGETRHLVRPFLVMATQNPIEQEGTYQLPEAQLDRFFFKVHVKMSGQDEMREVVNRTTRNVTLEAKPILDAARILQAQALALRIVTAPHVQDYAVRLVLATHPTGELCPEHVRRYIRVGVSPRGAQALIRAAKVRALIGGRYAVGFKDLKEIAFPALRHRIVRSFEAEADGITNDRIIAELMRTVPNEGEE
jgi:MoxR-like ATPase